MNFLTLQIEDNTPQARNIQAYAEAEHIDPEAAALKLLATLPLTHQSKATPAARRIVGVFSSPEEAALMDEVTELAMNARRAAIERVTGSLQGADWIQHDFNDQKSADIERENQRDLI